MEKKMKNKPNLLIYAHYYYPDVAAKVMTVMPYYEPKGALLQRLRMTSDPILVV